MPKAKKAAKKSPKMETKSAVATPTLDYGKMAERFAQATTGGGSDWFKFTESRHRLRIIPFFNTVDDMMDVMYPEATHFNCHPKHPVLRCKGPGCPICAVVNDITDRTRKQQYKANKKFLLNVVDVDAENPVVVPFRAPKGLWDNMKDIIENTKDYKNSLDLKKGIDFICSKTGSGMDTRYSATPAMERTAVEFTGTPVDFAGRQAGFDAAEGDDYEAIAADMITG